MSVNAGEVVAITGPSGCGKSTLLRCINRLVEPDAGEVVLDGVPVTSLGYPGLRRLRSSIGFVFQHFNLVRRLTVIENVILGAEMSCEASRTCRDEVEARAARALDRVGIPRSLFLRRPDSLSGGEQQRVAIARAIAMDPKLMLWDEPTASLDPILVQEVLDVMEDLIEKEHITMLVVTHEMRFAARAATRLVLLDHGKIVEDGSPAKVLCSPTSELGRRYARLAQTLACGAAASNV
ncbi:MAG TPA: amino acid ABC transporter ATP-binding protein [Firmicutes bacterium]|nr:amino acid ABC transporter ATP-binding protein [Bacillota bacterium]